MTASTNLANTLFRAHESVTENRLAELAKDFALYLMTNDSFTWPLLIEMRGELGAGKTTFVRALLRALGHQGAVKSPTYGLLEPYPDLLFGVYHWDLYRLEDPEELEALGFREYYSNQHCCLVEWMNKGIPYLPSAQIVVTLEVEVDSDLTRRIIFQQFSLEY